MALLLAAKEAVYKCQYPLTRAVLTWADVVVVFASSTFQASVRGPDPMEITGTFASADGWVAALAWLYQRRDFK